ncbi:prepilin-type N-terminal cleavage/methylation domain-containing protein [Ruminiclostridium josui]|uniref:prepilin-type N-terminal cleavage/methylation domain-containing protein n=1 Tax=Ruminiclostridium josui TaxID=1499 RepID=UPI00046669E0|nr:prepilin-type N-terminal cleavage/methylation domain-containing protein [Ruminiclostridium josui]
MFKFIKKVKKNQKGYTLTELIVVVAILGILAAVATPMVLNQVQKARNSADAANLKAIQNAYLVGMAGDSNASVPSDFTGVKNKIGDALASIPKPHDSNKKFYINPKTGEVTAATATPSPTADWINMNP